MRKRIICFAVLGFIGAAVFYSPYIGINAQFGLECPVCPHITTMWGTPLQRFFRFTLVGGIMNAVLFMAVGSLAVFCGRALRRLFRSGMTTARR